MQQRTQKVKEYSESLKVGLGDVMKFGRVRFRVKKLEVNKKDSSDYKKSGD